MLGIARDVAGDRRSMIGAHDRRGPPARTTLRRPRRKHVAAECQIRSDMRIPPDWLDCTFYAYKSIADATSGRPTGGSGCVVSVPSQHERWVHVYAVTNRHVIDGGFGVLRFNTHMGAMSTIETKYGDW